MILLLPDIPDMLTLQTLSLSILTFINMDNYFLKTLKQTTCFQEKCHYIDAFKGSNLQQSGHVYFILIKVPKKHRGHDNVELKFQTPT